jgi:hypothetical protein
MLAACDALCFPARLLSICRYLELRAGFLRISNKQANSIIHAGSNTAHFKRASWEIV